MIVSFCIYINVLLGNQKFLPIAKLCHRLYKKAVRAASCQPLMMNVMLEVLSCHHVSGHCPRPLGMNIEVLRRLFCIIA